MYINAFKVHASVQTAATFLKDRAEQLGTSNCVRHAMAIKF